MHNLIKISHNAQELGEFSLTDHNMLDNCTIANQYWGLHMLVAVMLTCIYVQNEIKNIPCGSRVMIHNKHCHLLVMDGQTHIVIIAQTQGSCN